MHISKLARLKLGEDEMEALSTQLTNILAHFNEIAKVDTKGVEPLRTPSEVTMFLREDVVVPPLPVEQLLQNAPERAGNLFKVPPVV